MSLYVVGLDGLTFDLVDRWIDSLPNLRALKQGGAATSLNSVHPPITGPAWMSIYTGLDPSVFNRYHFNHFNPDDRSFSATSRSGLGYEYFWERLDDERICLLNLPMTYPPSDQDNTIVCGHMGAPGSVVTKPDSLTDDLAAAGVELAYHDLTETSKTDPDAFMSEGTRQFEVMSDAWHVLEDRDSWDLFFGQFSVADWAHHFLWDDLKTSSDPHLRKIYQRIDSFIGDVRDKLGPDDDLVIVSDHGGGNCKGVIYLNELLRREGLLVLENDGGSVSNQVFNRLDITKSTIEKYDVLNLLEYVREHVPARIKSSIPTEGSGRAFASLVNSHSIDWRASSAYVLSDGLLFCDGAAIDLIENYLETRGLSVDFVDLQCEYTTDSTQMPDYVVYIEDLAFEIKDDVFTNDIVAYDPDSHSHQGSHRRNGVFIGHGPSFETCGFSKTNAWLPDIAPTLLAVLGRDIPEAMTGDPLINLLDDHALADRQPERISYSIKSDTDKLSRSEEQQVNERLQNLGYLK
ncbi:alkaline phosphatase family protein [Halorubrum ezzemoulense]|nr:alkaline phosphatase family protein [Halorubrum ezzemoulense]